MANDNMNSPKDAAMAILAKAQKLLDNKSSAAIEDIKVEDMKKSYEHTSGLHTVAYYSLDKHSAQQAALAVLAKSQDMLSETISIKTEGMQKSAEAESGMHKVEYYKSETGHEKGINTQSDPSQKSRVMMGTSKAGSQLPSKHKADHEEAKGVHKQVLGEMNRMPKPNLPKSENPDEKQDAKLGEAVEHLCEDHMVRNASAERKEGHKLVSKAECAKCVGGMQKSEWAELYEDLAKMEKYEGENPTKENEIGTKIEKGEWNKIHRKLEDEGYSKKTADKIDGAIKAKLGKAENKTAPSNDMKPKIEEKPIERDNRDFETKPGHAPENDHREMPQHPTPDQNPAAHGQGSNPPAGATPGTGKKGVHKLSFFMGHQHSKKGMKKGIALG